MYANKLVVAIKTDHKVLREFGDTIHLPFGKTYSILIKNLNSVRASIRISIDGSEIGDDISLIVNSNSEIEVERFIKNGNLNAGNKFKFIERTIAIENHRGINAEDSIIRVEYQFEKLRTIQNFNIRLLNASNSLRSSSNAVSNTSGITVPGEVSNQQFQSVKNFTLDEQKHVIIMRIVGEVKGTHVDKVLYTRSTNKCVTCGKNSNSAARFCSECGTSLQIIN